MISRVYGKVEIRSFGVKRFEIPPLMWSCWATCLICNPTGIHESRLTSVIRAFCQCRFGHEVWKIKDFVPDHGHVILGTKSS